MLTNLYIFHSTGKLLLSKSWTGEAVKEDPVLISGFLSAIWMFAKKIGSKGGVRNIHIGDKLLVGVSSPTYDLLFVLVAKPNAEVAACKALLGRIRRSFIQKHRTLLKDSRDLPTDVFEGWLRNLDIITADHDVAPVESVMKKFLRKMSETTDEDED